MKGSLALVISIILIVIAGGVVCFFNQNQMRNLEDQIYELANAKDLSTDLKTENWQVYYDINNGYEVSYPNGWEASVDSGMIRVANYADFLHNDLGPAQSDNQITFFFSVDANKDDLTAEEILNKTSVASGVDGGTSVGSQKTITVADMEATKIDYSTGVGDRIAVYIPTEEGKFVVIDCATPSAANADAIFTSILGTFSFVSE